MKILFFIISIFVTNSVYSNEYGDWEKKYPEYKKIFDNKRQKPYLNSDEDDNKRFVSRSLLWIVIDGLISCSFKK